MSAFASPDIASAYDQPDQTGRGMIALRDLVFEIASELPQIGPLEEALKWGQPAFVTPAKKAASSLRVGPHKRAEFALYVHCQTSLISEYQAQFPDQDRFDGNRAILFDTAEQIDPLRHGWLIRRALCYHL